LTRLRDPERNELNSLLWATPLAGKSLLEIGCGSGWLTRQLAGTPGQIFGIDPEIQDLRLAKTYQPRSLKNPWYTASAAEALPFPASSFEVAVFANTL
jgi:ubiquinone/menaquinone biosynthesis C-methylase UbiE